MKTVYSQFGILEILDLYFADSIGCSDWRKKLIKGESFAFSFQGRSLKSAATKSY